MGTMSEMPWGKLKILEKYGETPWENFISMGTSLLTEHVNFVLRQNRLWDTRFLMLLKRVFLASGRATLGNILGNTMRNISQAENNLKNSHLTWHADFVLEDKNHLDDDLRKNLGNVLGIIMGKHVFPGRSWEQYVSQIENSLRTQCE